MINLKTFKSTALAALMIGLGLSVCAAASPTEQRRVVAYDNVRLTVLDRGAGPAVVMIPSLGRGASDFDDLTDRFVAAGFRVLRLEPRGIDGSEGPMTGLTMRDLASDVAHVITGSGLKQAVVLGHDDGNRIARSTAAYYPGLVSAVILVGAGGKAKPDPAAIAALSASFDDRLSAEDHLRNVATGFFAPGNDPSAWRGGWYAQTARMERAAGAATPLSDWWTAGSAPILIVQARQDRIAPPENAALLKADVGDRARVVYVDRAGHALLPEQPAAVAAAVIGYLHDMALR